MRLHCINICFISQIDSLMGSLSSVAREVGVSMENASAQNPLPPSSVQQFLKKRAIPSVVLTDHDEAYTNE